MTFAQQLKAEQDRLDKTQAEMAAILSVSARTYWQWVNDVKSPLAVAQEGALARLRAH